MAVKVDENGFLKYEDTTFFREGIFDYAGCEIDPQGKLGLEPKKIYKVYRPKSEITKKEFVETLNQKPLVDDHTIIGNKPGMMAPERKNCAGVLSDVKVVGNELHGRLDIWSTKMISKIRSGKRELSLAYGCTFIPQKGVFKGERYDFVQSELRAGNHLALVDEARNGHDCRVVDCAFICDSKFQLEQPDMDWKTISADDLINGLKECSDEAKAKAKEFLNTPTEDELKNVVIAYEPIWAIGTGKTATPEQAEEVCESIRAVIRKMYGAKIARAISILDGGSMNDKNAYDLLAQPDIDGGLIGGASLVPEKFVKIIEAANQPTI